MRQLPRLVPLPRDGTDRSHQHHSVPMGRVRVHERRPAVVRVGGHEQAVPRRPVIAIGVGEGGDLVGSVARAGRNFSAVVRPRAEGGPAHFRRGVLERGEHEVGRREAAPVK